MATRAEKIPGTGHPPGLDEKCHCEGVILQRQHGGANPFVYRQADDAIAGNASGRVGQLLDVQDWAAAKNTVRKEFHSIVFQWLHEQEPWNYRLFAMTEIGEWAYPSPWTKQCCWVVVS
jgi:hypothetical protein